MFFFREKMYASMNVMMVPFGYRLPKYFSDSKKKWIVLSNTVNAFGIIPGIGTIIGISWILFFTYFFFHEGSSASLKDHYKAQIFRGLLEVTSILGPFLLAMDLKCNNFFLLIQSTQDVATSIFRGTVHHLFKKF